MALTLGPILLDADIDLSNALVIRHAYVREHEDSGISGIHADSTDEDILEYTRNQSANTRRFPADPPRFWAVFIREGGDQARLLTDASEKVIMRPKGEMHGCRREACELDGAVQ